MWWNGGGDGDERLDGSILRLDSGFFDFLEPDHQIFQSLSRSAAPLCRFFTQPT
jgi:hypothetical protein